MAALVCANPSVNLPYGVLPVLCSGSLLVYRQPKAVPMKWGKCRGVAVTKGERLGDAEHCGMFPLSLFAIAHRQNAGWNMVVLLRCRLQYSLFRPILPSLYRPLGALGSNPPQAVAPFYCTLTAPPPSSSKTPRPGRKAGCAACRRGGI